jgi:hypothetical protein
VAWFVGQSLLIIVAAFLLGVLIGWLVWGIAWRRPEFDGLEHLQAPQTPSLPPAPVIMMPLAAVAEPEAADELEHEPRG